MEKSWFMSLESVFTLQLAKTFLVSEVQPSLLGIVLWLQQFTWLEWFWFALF